MLLLVSVISLASLAMGANPYSEISGTWAWGAAYCVYADPVLLGNDAVITVSPSGPDFVTFSVANEVGGAAGTYNSSSRTFTWVGVGTRCAGVLGVTPLFQGMVMSCDITGPFNGKNMSGVCDMSWACTEGPCLKNIQRGLKGARVQRK